MKGIEWRFSGCSKELRKGKSEPYKAPEVSQAVGFDPKNNNDHLKDLKQRRNQKRLVDKIADTLRFMPGSRHEQGRTRTSPSGSIRR